MHNWWIRFGCFLTGYNYHIVNASSEVAAKAVKRYTSALLIVGTVWAFIGYMFTSRYLHGGTWGSVAGAVIMVLIIIQVERQIILTVTPSKWLYFFRGLIAIMMAILGAIIIDQIIFKEDIELEQVSLIDEKVNKILPAKTADLRQQIIDIDSTITAKEAERLALMNDISKNPTIQSVTTQTVPLTVTNSVTDSLKNTRTTDRIVNANSRTVSSIPNPKMSFIQPLDMQIEGLRKRKNNLDSNLLALRPMVEKEIREKVGFLDELKVMYKLISESNIAMTVWFLWFFFLLGLEMFVLISKTSEKKNDYEETVLHQMNIQMKKLKLLENASERN
jgi:predicted subunit of tRNA(5-methylaminomethyl-2-thiouridylate) methyltransferase